MILKSECSIAFENSVPPKINPALNLNYDVKERIGEIKAHLLKQLCNFIFLLLNRVLWDLHFPSQLQRCTRCANEKAYFVRKAKHMELGM